MKLHSLFLFFSLVFSVLSCSQEDIMNDNNLVYFKLLKEKNSFTDLELELMKLINDYRQEIKIPLLNLNIIASSVAQQHTEYMIENNKVSHANFNIRSLYLITEQNAISVGENVGYGYATAQALFMGYLKSDTHRKTIETSSFNNIGISTKMSANNRSYNTIILFTK